MQPTLKDKDREIYDAIQKEKKRQRDGLVLIPSENYTSNAVRQAVGSILENKYAEGYPKKRYYTGNANIDVVEQTCIDRTKQLFGVPFANVQPYSGSPANLEIFGAVCKIGDTVLSQHLSHGGHLSMGQEASYTGRYYRAVYYHLTADGEIDFSELEKLAVVHKPKIIWSGGTAYTKQFDWKRYGRIAEKTGAYFIADISHIAGLIAGGAHPSPVPYAHLVMTTTHKTLRGPRGAIIMVTEIGMEKNPDLPKLVNYSVFPGHQGGPHENTIAGIAVALKEAASPAFAAYAQQIVKNAQALAEYLAADDIRLIGNGTQNHMIWIDLRNKNIDGWEAHVTLEKMSIYGNKQTIPNDPNRPFYPSGFRIGTPALTTRGMREQDMQTVGSYIVAGIECAKRLHDPDIGHSEKKRDQEARKRFKMRLSSDKHIALLQKKIAAFARKFPVP